VQKPSVETSVPVTKTSTTKDFEVVICPPELIKMVPDSYYDEVYFDFVPKYRPIYYMVPGEISDLIDPAREEMDSMDALIKSRCFTDGVYTDCDEMYVAVVVEYYNISREDFDEALKKRWQFYISDGREIKPDEEGWEFPNPDILYTFDNEIINAYYRRDNPVVPELGTYTTFGSYEEYLKANP